MLNKQTNQTKKVSATDNLKKIADIFFGKQYSNALQEIKKAQDAIDSVSAKIQKKIGNVSVPNSKLQENQQETAETKSKSPSIPKKVYTRDPGKFSASSFGQTQIPKRMSQAQLQNARKPKDAVTYGQRTNGAYSAYGQRNGSYVAGRSNYARPGTFQKFGARPLNRLGKGEVDINVNTLQAQQRTFGNKKKSKNVPQEHKQLSKKAQMRWQNEELDDENSTRIGRKYKARKKEEPVRPVEATKIEKALITTDNLTVKMLSEKIGISVAEIVKKLFILGIMATINSDIDFETAELVSNEFGIKLERKVEATAEEQLMTKLQIDDKPEDLQKRPPIVTVMGHVDHGKTSLLDAIRNTNVVSGEAGGITQKIGAYVTKVNGRSITFIDTPGHAAFTAMRARGAQITDIAILIVAADDGIMPQTIEAINHIKDAKVPMIVAINKIDKPEANVDRVMKELADHGILPEEWGGDTICVPISAKRGTNIDKLLEMVLLEADVLDLKANPNRSAVATVIESRLDKGKGPVASVLVQNGTLNVGDTVVAGIAFGKVRAMIDENGKNVKHATPSTPVQILGLDAVPEAGDRLTVVDAKMKNQIIQERKNKIKQDKIKTQSAVSIDDFFNKVKEGSLKVLNLIIKADTQGSAEALTASLANLKNEEAKVVCVHTGVGNINESDVLLAQASNSIIIGFDVVADDNADKVAKQDNIEIKLYDIIYECIEEVQRMLKGMLAPKFVEKTIGAAEVRQLFKISSIGTVAGCYVLDGKVVRNAKVHVIRNSKQIAEAEIESLKVQKNEAKEVGKGQECGIKLKNFDDLQQFDQLEIIVKEQVNI